MGQGTRGIPVRSALIQGLGWPLALLISGLLANGLRLRDAMVLAGIGLIIGVREWLLVKLRTAVPALQ
jgi:hypothetical protein